MQKRKELEGQVRSLRRELAAAAHQQQKAGAAPSLEQPRQQQQPEGTQQTATSGAHPAAGAAAAALGEQSSRGLQLGKGELPAGSRQPRPAQEAGQHIGKGVIMQVPGLGWRKGTVDAYVPGRVSSAGLGKCIASRAQVELCCPFPLMLQECCRPSL